MRLDIEEGLDLAPEHALTVYRVIQEALTSTLRHAGPGTVSVTVRHPGELRIDVVEHGSGPGPRFPAGGGNGLVGIRERGALLGGELSAGPEPRGFAVRARIPLEPAP